MRKKFILPVLCLLLVAAPLQAYTTPPPLPLLSLIREALVRAIKAIDLRIQRLQNKTIWLQNAQKEMENTLSKLKLKEIGDWTQKQKDLYQHYYDELAQVKSVITYYQRIRDITQKQGRLVSEYQRAWGLLQQDGNFTDRELDYMQKVYQGILAESLENLEQIFTVLESFTTDMTDAERLELINSAADTIDVTYDDLKRFNTQNMMLSLQRAKTAQDVQAVKIFYGLP